MRLKWTEKLQFFFNGRQMDRAKEMPMAQEAETRGGVEEANDGRVVIVTRSGLGGGERMGLDQLPP